MRVIRITALAVAGAFLVALAAAAPATKIKKTELPEAVRAAVDRHAPGAHLRACWRIAGDGGEMYEVDVKVDGVKKGFIIAPDGKLLTIQEEVAWHELPGAVQDRLERAARGNEIEEVYSIAQHGELVGYGARIDGEGIGVRDYNVQVGPHGEDFGGEAPSRSREAWREPPSAPDQQPQPDQEPPPEPEQAPPDQEPPPDQ